MISSIVKPGDLCFDIGAHQGDKSLEMLRLGARVIAVEPTPNLMRVQDKNLTFVNKAVSDKQGRAKFTVCRTSTISTMAPHWKTGRFAVLYGEADKVIDVETTTLDKLIEEFGKPNFCKIDVEGHEFQVLCGLSKKNAIPCLSFEFTAEFYEEASKSIALLSILGYNEFTFTGPTQSPEGFEMDWGSPLEVSAKVYDKCVNGCAYWGDIYART